MKGGPFVLPATACPEDWPPRTRSKPIIVFKGTFYCQLKASFLASSFVPVVKYIRIRDSETFAAGLTRLLRKGVKTCKNIEGASLKVRSAHALAIQVGADVSVLVYRFEFLPPKLQY